MTAVEEDVRAATVEGEATATTVATAAGREPPFGDLESPFGDLESPFGDLPYGPRMTALLPALHAGFGAFNRYWAGPALRLGLGRYLSNPLTGYMMLLRTRGRTSGRRREAPLAYVIVGDAVYCTAGFGARTHWLQNLAADPHVEVLLPDRSFGGLAAQVSDADEIRRVVRPLAESTRFFGWLFTGVDPARASDAELSRVFGQFPVVRIVPTGIAAGPNDPGGSAWLISSAAVSVVALSLVRPAGRVARRVFGGRAAAGPRG